MDELRRRREALRRTALVPPTAESFNAGSGASVPALEASAAVRADAVVNVELLSGSDNAVCGYMGAGPAGKGAFPGDVKQTASKSHVSPARHMLASGSKQSCQMNATRPETEATARTHEAIVSNIAKSLLNDQLEVCWVTGEVMDIDLRHVASVYEARSLIASALAVQPGRVKLICEDQLMEDSARLVNTRLTAMLTDLDIRVFCRVRALTRYEREQGESTVVASLDERTLQVQDHQGHTDFSFDAVFTPKSADDIVDACHDLVVSVVAGNRGTIFAYGQTGAGKSFTMLGDFQAARGTREKTTGVIPRAFQWIFEETRSNSNDFDFVVSGSILELYMSDIVDLLHKRMVAGERRQSSKMVLKLDEQGIVQIAGLNEVTCQDAGDLFQILEDARREQDIIATCMSRCEHASRSHLIVIVKVKRIDKRSGESTIGKLLMCDLAGSERLKKSMATADAQKETIEINKSLTALGNVMEALSTGKKQVPYRNHKLTQILYDTLGGAAGTIAIMAISPASSKVDETLMSMQWAKRFRPMKP